MSRNNTIRPRVGFKAPPKHGYRPSLIREICEETGMTQLRTVSMLDWARARVEEARQLPDGRVRINTDEIGLAEKNLLRAFALLFPSAPRHHSADQPTPLQCKVTSALLGSNHGLESPMIVHLQPLPRISCITVHSDVVV